MSGTLTHFHSLLPYCTEPGDREGGGGRGHYNKVSIATLYIARTFNMPTSEGRGHYKVTIATLYIARTFNMPTSYH